MAVNLTKMAIEEMDLKLMLKEFQKISNARVTTDVLLQFMESVIPMYESSKKEAIGKLIDSASIDLISQMWDDPMDIDLYGRLHELKKIAKTLKIEINAV